MDIFLIMQAWGVDAVTADAIRSSSFVIRIKNIQDRKSINLLEVLQLLTIQPLFWELQVRLCLRFLFQAMMSFEAYLVVKFAQD